MGEKGPKTYMKNINEKAREREWNLKPSVVLCGVCTFWEKKGALCWQRLCVLCRALFSFLFLFLFFFKVCMYNLVCVCVYILEERSWCSRSLFLLGLGRFSLYRDTRSLWRSLNTRGGCFRERNSKSTNPKARAVFVQVLPRIASSLFLFPSTFHRGVSKARRQIPRAARQKRSSSFPIRGERLVEKVDVSRMMNVVRSRRAK